MKFPVVKPLTYISPSTFNTWMLCETKLYLKKLSGHPYIKDLSSKAAAIGSAYGAFLVDYIAQKKKIDSPHLRLGTMLNKIKVEKGIDKAKCLSMAKDLAVKYTKLPLIQRILDSNEIYLEVPRFAYIAGIPLYGIPDVVADGLPIDFKCRPLSTSPTKGYKKRYTLTGMEQPPYHTTMSLDECHEDWAVQMTIYSWLCGSSFGSIQYVIHELVGGVVVEHIGSIDPKFKINLKEQLAKMWENINELNAEIDDPSPCTSTCEKWNSLCEVAPLCSAYMTTLGDPKMREMM